MVPSTVTLISCKMAFDELFPYLSLVKQLEKLEIHAK
jgi:hypothetical protein